MVKEDRKFSSPTIMDVARESGVSYSTVSRALNGYEFVRPATRDKVLRIAEKIGYVPNQHARSLAGGRSNLVGVLVPSLTNGYTSEIIRGIDDELTQANYNLILYTTHRRQGRESAYVASIMNGAADGLLLVVPLLSAKYLDTLHEQNFPYVLIDQSDNDERCSVVNATNWQGAYDAVQYLIESGHRRIAFVTGIMELSGAAERLQGYKAALSEYGIPLRNELIVDGHFQQNGGYAATQTLLDLSDRPTAIFASNDLSALGAMQAIRERGLRIPEDISVVGFDDMPEAATSFPKLTTVHQPLDQMGRVAVRMLLERFQHPTSAPQRVTLATRLIIRESCQPPASIE